MHEDKYPPSNIGGIRFVWPIVCCSFRRPILRVNMTYIHFRSNCSFCRPILRLQITSTLYIIYLLGLPCSSSCWSYGSSPLVFSNCLYVYILLCVVLVDINFVYTSTHMLGYFVRNRSIKFGFASLRATLITRRRLHNLVLTFASRVSPQSVFTCRTFKFDFKVRRKEIQHRFF